VQVTEIGWVQLVPYIIMCHCIGCSNLWGEVTLLCSLGNLLQLWLVFCFSVAFINSLPPPYLPATIVQNLQKIYNVLKWVFVIFPQFYLGQELIELYYNQIKYVLTHNFSTDSYVSPFEMNFLGWIYMELALQGTVLLLRNLLHWDLL
jgi:hypothetical protein